MNVRRKSCGEKAATLAWTVRRLAMYSARRSSVTNSSSAGYSPSATNISGKGAAGVCIVHSVAMIESCTCSYHPDGPGDPRHITSHTSLKLAKLTAELDLGPRAGIPIEWVSIDERIWHLVTNDG